MPVNTYFIITNEVKYIGTLATTMRSAGAQELGKSQFYRHTAPLERKNIFFMWTTMTKPL